MKFKFRAQVAAMMLMAPAAVTLLAQPAAAQQNAVVAQAPTITNMAVNSDAGLQPGATLRFQLYARANASRADMVLGDSGIVVPLRQQSAGNYTGSYVVRRQDRIDPTQMIAARVKLGNGPLVARNFSWPPAFQALAMGANPAPVVAAGPAIERFVMRPMGGRIEPGAELRFRLVGAPGADAWLDIPGVITGVDLAEVRPGVYEGMYTVRRRDNVDAFPRAVATLRAGKLQTTAHVDVRGGDRDWGGAPTAQRRDDRPPQITDLTPANGDRISERGRTHISARLSDEGSGVDVNTVRLRLAGRDVTGESRVTADEIHFRGDLDPGRYTAELTVRDVAGNATTKAWTFDVIDGPRGDRRDGDRERDRDRVGGGPLPLQVTSHPNNAIIDGSVVTLQGRTAPNASVRIQVESVVNVGGVLGVTRPVMDETVQADRNGNFSVAMQPGGYQLPGGRYDVRLTATSGNQTSEERMTLQRRG